MVSGNSARTPIILVVLMLFSSLSPLMELNASAHPSKISEWGSGGYNNTGWLSIDAIGADPDNGILAEGDLHLNLAPGAAIENLSFEVRVNGSNGTWVNPPEPNQKSNIHSYFLHRVSESRFDSMPYALSVWL